MTHDQLIMKNFFCFVNNNWSILSKNKMIIDSLIIALMNYIDSKDNRSLRLVDKKFNKLIRDLSPIVNCSGHAAPVLVEIYEQRKWCQSQPYQKIEKGLTVIGSSFSVNDDKTGFWLTIQAIYLPFLENINNNNNVTLIIDFTTDEWINLRSVSINLNQIDSLDSLTFFNISMDDFVIESKTEFQRISYCIKLKFNGRHNESFDNSGNHHRMVNDHLNFCPRCFTRSNFWNKCVPVCEKCFNRMLSLTIAHQKPKNNHDRKGGVMGICCTYGTVNWIHRFSMDKSLINPSKD